MGGSDSDSFFGTPERTAAWVFRVLLTSISAIGAIALWLGKTELQDIKGTIDSNNKALWQEVGTITKTQNTEQVSIGQLTSTVSDYIANENGTIQEIKTEQADHETRIRVLERPNDP